MGDNGLRDLGFEEELNWHRFGADGDYGRSTTVAVAAFAAHVGVPENGHVLTLELAELIVEELSQYYGNSWRSPAHTPTPAPNSLSIVSVVGRKNRQFLEVSDGVHKKRFGRYGKGLYTVGTQKPANFVNTHADKLRALKITESEIKVMISVAENEGNLDAINTWDNAFLSFGLFQWTAGTGNSKGELPALVARIKDADTDLFERYFGQHGLDVAGTAPGDMRGKFSLRGTILNSPDAKSQLRQASWAFYFWLAGQDPAI